MTLTSSWLTTAASAFICASALSTASAYSIQSSAHELAEQIKTDIKGNMIWNDQDQDEIPSLTRPDFKSYPSSKSNPLDSLHDWISSKHHGEEEDLKKHLNSVFDQVKDSIHKVEEKLDQLDHVIHDGKKQTQKWISEGLVEVDGMQFERHIHPSFPNYSLRLSTSKNQSLCDPNVKQHSGYLDIGEDKHLWFVFFESRSNPKKDPVMLWLNGGPGCSSSTGLLFELGPCTIQKDGLSTVNNPYSWTNNANMIFLDQPVAVGYSYTEGDSVNNTPQAAQDVYAFLQLFFKKFPEYSTQEFSLAAESYGGRYGPVIASTLNSKNKALARSRYVGENAPKHINLSTLMLGNGLTSAKTQFGSVKEYACDGEYAIFDSDSATCQSLEQKSGVCQNLIEQCYKYDSRLTCTPAAIYCWSSLYGPAQQSGLNLYDVRKKCNRDEDKDGPLCYPAMQAIEKYMNQDYVKESFGVPSSVEFQSCNMQVNQAFMMQGDSMHDTSLLLPELIEDGMRLLVYAGEADFMCNALGNERWVTELETSYKDEFAQSNGTWFVKQASKQSKKDPKQTGGWFKKAGKGAGNVAFVKVKDSGHMVPMDQPEAASDLITRWLANESFSDE